MSLPSACTWRDNARLLRTLRGLWTSALPCSWWSNDEETIRSADWIVDLGLGAGEHGGEVIAEGPVEAILQSDQSLTAAYLTGRLQIPVPEKRRNGNGKLYVVGARENNLKNIDVRILLGRLVVHHRGLGIGKSSLMVEVLYKALARHSHHSHTQPGDHDRIEGLEHLDKIIIIDRAPSAAPQASTPATYTGVFDEIRSLYADLPESKIRGYKFGRF